MTGLMEKTARRQRIRKGLIILSFILYPATYAYISCPIITEGASMGIVTGGLIVFGMLFIGSLFLGRIWCGYFCPTGGLQEIYRLAYDRPLRTRKLNILKYLVFLGIFGSLFYAAYTAGGFSAIDIFYWTESGISIAGPGGLTAFLGPVVVVTVFALIFGRRGFCHTFCPIGVMLIIGRKIRNLFYWPALQLEAENDKCIDCRKCSKECPMTLDVNRMVREEKMEQSDCILCGNCVDICPTGTIIYSVNGR